MGTVGTHAINASLYAKMPYDHVKDFAPVILVAGVPNVLVVNPSRAGELRAGADRLRQGQSRQAQLRVVGQRHVDPPRRRTVQDDGRRADDARALQGQRAGAHRPARRPGAAHVRQPAVVAAADQGRQAARARRDQRAARVRAARRADRRRGRAAGLRGVVVVRPAGAGRHAEGRRREAQRRSREVARVAGGEGEARVAGRDRRGPVRPRTSRATSRPRPRSGRRS